MENTFNEPRLALNRIYTKRGDQGETSLAGGQRLGKDHPRIEAYGCVDELNSHVGMACHSAARNADLGDLAVILRRVQHELFNLGSELATKAEDLRPKQPRVTEAEVHQLEKEIDRMNETLSMLRSFVLPGGSQINTELHVCRTVCRRAERLAVALSRIEPVRPEVVQYLNRLSDAFFVWSRWANQRLGIPEVLWQPNEAAGGR